VIYLFFNTLAMTFLYLRGRYNFNGLYILFFITICILPSVQYAVGTDYYSYERIYTIDSVLEHYYDNGEFAFFYFVKVLQLISRDAKFFFMAVSILQSILITVIFIKFKKVGFAVFFLFFLFFSVTNLMHTQMNIIRVSFSIYIFILSIFLKLEGKFLFSLMVFFLGCFFHKSTYAMLPFFILPVSIYEAIYKKAGLFFLLSFLVCFFDPFGRYVPVIIETIFPSYSIYYVDGESLINVSILNVLTKLYYLPVNILFIYFLWRNVFQLSIFEKRLIGFWVIISSSYFLSYHYGFFSRVNFFLVFYYIIPIYYVFSLFRKRNNAVLLIYLIGYIILPYIFKVVFFPLAEFHYETFLF